MAPTNPLTVIITQAAAPLGIALAQGLARQGANLILAVRTSAQAEALTGKLPANALIVLTDEARQLDCKMLIDKAVVTFGGLDVLINNALCDDWQTNLNTPSSELLLKSPMRLTRLAMPYLKRSAAGCVINVAALSGRFPLDGDPPYSTSQFGLRGYCFALADDLRQAGVRLCSVAPNQADAQVNIDLPPANRFTQPLTSPRGLAQTILACAIPAPRDSSLLAAPHDFGAPSYLFA